MPIDWRVTFDSNANTLAAVARWIVGERDRHEKLLMVRTLFSDPAHARWRALLGAALEHQGMGCYADLWAGRERVAGAEEIRLLDPASSGAVDEFRMDTAAAPATSEKIQSLRRSWSSWAKVEGHVGPDNEPVFSRLSGGMKPVIVVLDDYNNFIQRDREAFVPNESGLKAVAALYFPNRPLASAEGALRECLIGYCATLNNLSAAFDVRCPKLWIGAAGYEEVAASLDGDRLGLARDQIAAFLVDLEWKPILPPRQRNGQDEAWASMGHRAIHLLSRRFPEIPSFVFAGGHPYRKLQNALLHGALWCFTKAKSHHGYDAREEEPLTALALERHLADGARVRYGSFDDLPFPGQLKLETSMALARKLASKLDFRFPLGRCAVGRDLQSLVARLFPDGAQVWPERVLDTGRSKAQATFFLAAEKEGQRLATRFIKVGPWFDIQREYLAYKRVIEPRLNNHVANIVGEPAVSVSQVSGVPKAGLVYSLAGFPEDFDGLKSLDDMLHSSRDDMERARAAGESIRQTLRRVLKPMYTRAEHQQRVGVKQVRRPLWCWLGDVLPPVFTGVLPPIGWKANQNPKRLESYIDQGYKQATAWVLGARDCRDRPRGEKLSPWHLEGTSVELQGFQLLDVDWGPGELDTGEITLRHPDLGFRIRLRGRAGDIRRRFGAMWMRPGMPVDVIALLDKDSGELDKIDAAVQCGLDALGMSSESTDAWRKAAFPNFTDEEIPDPREVFSGQNSVPLHYTIAACQSPIHGDLNPRNILLAEEGATGWLIDFERALEQGMTAFDLAKLEIEIWHHHLLPVLESITAGLSSGDEKLVGLQSAALAAVDADMDPDGAFEARVRDGLMAMVPEQLLDGAKRLLWYISLIRGFARETLGWSQEDLRWALSAYFFVSVKFAKHHPKRAALMFIASAWHLRMVCPEIAKDYRVCMDNVVKQTIRVAQGNVPDPVVDGLLLASQQRESGRTPELTVAMATPNEGRRVEWPEDRPGERWDLASTGGVANITPIIGYLWLMVKAERSRNQAGFDAVVPKISSRGGSCGTVDILESGGLSFPEDPHAVVDVCRSEGGILCRQSPGLTPVDAVMMSRRKKTNLMKDIGLTVASILSKKIAMGCTHTIIDVKVGRDSKILAPWMKNEDVGAFVTDVPLGSMFPDVAGEFKALLEDKLGFKSDDITLEESGVCKWLRHAPQWPEIEGNDVVLKEVRWFFTNSSMPQCRAIGRHLILIHLDRLVTQEGGEHLLFNGDKIKSTCYGQLYGHVLPELCGLGDIPDREKHDLLCDQWSRLKAMLPNWDHFPAQKVFDVNNKNKYKAFHGNDRESLETAVAVEEDLSVISVPAYPYIPGAKQGCEIHHMDAYELDSLFDWLCGNAQYDAEVGIWLHVLPGELIKDHDKSPVVSVFFRPSRTSEREVLERVRRFISGHVEIELVEE